MDNLDNLSDMDIKRSKGIIIIEIEKISERKIKSIERETMLVLKSWDF